MDTIRVLEIANNLGGLGGTGKTLELLVRYMDRNRFTPFIYSNQGFGGSRAQVFDTLNAPLMHDCALSSVLRETKPQVAHIHRFGETDPEMLETLHAAGVPVILETNIFGQLDESPSNALIDCHLFVSFFCLRRYQQWSKRPLVDDSCKVLYNPIDLAAFEAAGTLHRADGPPVIGHISRPEDTKWSPMTLDMLPVLLSQIPEVEYHIIGETPGVRDRIRALGVEAHVRYLPLASTDNAIIRFYQGIDVLAHGSSMGESFGCTIAEAMAAAKPVISHPNHNLADNAQTELIDHGITGFIAHSPETYASHAAYLLRRPRIAERWGQNGREKVRACYNAPLITRGLEEIILHFCQKKGIPFLENGS